MVLKTNNMGDSSVSMTLDVDYERKEISVLVRYWDAEAREGRGYRYEAQEFADALDMFNKQEKLLKQKTSGKPEGKR